MKIEGISRVFIGVRDMDKAKAFFSNLFETEFVELTGPTVEALEERAAISLEANIELLSPRLPLSKNAPPYMENLVKSLEEKESVLMGLCYKVNDTKATAAEAERKGVSIDGVIETAEFDEALSWRNFKELIVKEEDTFGVMMTFSQYDRV